MAKAPTNPALPTLEQVRKQHKRPHDANKKVKQSLSPLDQLALWITTRVGTMGFFLVIFTWTVLWLGWNILAPKSLRFDEVPAFVLWLFISNLIQIFLMPLIMVGQNIQGRQADARSEHDLEVNVKAEKEIEVVLAHLEYQNSLLLQMVQKLDVNVAKAVGKAPRGKAG